MNRPYLVLVHGTLAARHLTKRGALRHIAELAARGIIAVLAYRLEGGGL